MQAADRASSLELSLLRYARLMRWGQFAEALTYHREVAGPQISAPLPSSDIRVSGFEPGQAVPGSATEAGGPVIFAVPVTLSYYSDTSAVVQKSEYLQHWWYEEESKHWFLTDPFPIPGAPAP